jgi:hypothetical protein
MSELDPSTRGTNVPPPPPPLAPLRAPGTVPVMPIDSLGYGTPWQRQRPGVITAIGVISIIMAALGMLGGLGSGVQMIGFAMMSTVSRTMATAGANAGATPSATTSPTSLPTSLSAADVQAVIAQVETLAKVQLTAAQSQAITQQLNAPGQVLVPPAASPQAAASQVQYAAKNIGGEVTFTTANGFMTVQPNGTVSSVSQFAAWGGGGGTMPVINIPPAAMVAAIVTWILSFGLAIFLLVCGIATLRQAASGRRLHLIYAWLKIPVAIASAAATAWLYHAMFGAFAGAGGGGPTWGLSVVGLVPALGLLYPVALLVVLNTRTVREYYATVTPVTEGAR